MAHPRELIAAWLVAALIAANTAAGTRVYGDRVDPDKKSGLPSLAVYVRNDQVNDAASSEMEEAHDLVLEIVVKAAPSAIGDLIQQAESVVRADPYFGGLASDSSITRTPTETVATDGHSDPIVAIAVLAVSANYHVALEPT